MIEELITNRITALGPEYRVFIESDFVVEAAHTFADTLQLTGRQVEVLENAILLYLLLIFTQEETIEFIARNCDLAHSEATTLWFGIASALPEGVALNLETVRNSIDKSQAPTSTPNLASEIAETEKSLESLQGIRTMAADMHAVAPGSHTEQTHRSTQEEILTPKAAIGGEQRWDTEG